MEMNSFRPDLHVAQQSRRDKLRIQQISNPCLHVEDNTHNLEQFSGNQGLNPNLFQLSRVSCTNISHDPSLNSAASLSSVANSEALLAQKDTTTVLHQESTTAHADNSLVTEYACFANLSHPLSLDFNPSAKVGGDPRNCGSWKDNNSQQSRDSIVNYSSGSRGIIESNQNPMFVGEGLSVSLKGNNISASALHMKSCHTAYQDVQSSLTNPSSQISSQNSQKHHGEIHFQSSPLCGNTVLDVLTSATIESRRLEMASSAQQNARQTVGDSWPDNRNELLPLHSYSDQSNTIHLNNASALIDRPVDICQQWGGELDFAGSRATKRGVESVMNDKSNIQCLSLSLSSVPLPKSQSGQIGGKSDFENLHLRADVYSDVHISRSVDLCSNLNHERVTDQKMVGTSTFAHRNTGPLGPFTGYATILESSKFLRPAQHLLDEFCCRSGQKPMKICKVPNHISGEDTDSALEFVFGGKDGESGTSSARFYHSKGINLEAGARSCCSESYRPEYQQRKEKLLCMLEEVCRRYKQYNHQMQMAFSSFESVEGLGSAVPYISLVFKTISRKFTCLRNSISCQIRCTRQTLGEDLSFLTTGASGSLGESSTSRSKFVEQSFQNNVSDGGYLGFWEPQHVWRRQRGLPERAVAVLRAWLFDHFLHPYPTDTEKHMLAIQTGLSRNQVSNWFINARVRVWKPMVEDIHMLETKSLAETNSNAGKTDGKHAIEDVCLSNTNPSKNGFCINPVLDNTVNCMGVGSSACTRDLPSAELWGRDKQSSAEHQIPRSMGGSLMHFMPYQRRGLEIGGMGSVSLTLGLRQSAENAQHQYQLQQEQHLNQHFGGQMIHDLVN